MVFIAWTIKDVKLYRSLFVEKDSSSSLITLRLSAYIYARLYNLNALAFWYVPFIASLIFINKEARFQYDLRFYNKIKLSSRYLRNAEYLYLKLLNFHFPNSNTNTVVINTGTARLPEMIIGNYFNKSSHLYWEAGIGGTIYFSKIGVNADSDFRFSLKSDFVSKSKNALSITKKPLRSNSKLEKLCKFIEMIYLLFCAVLLRNPELKELLPTNLIRLNKIKNVDTNDDFILFVDQVEADTNSTHFGLDKFQIANLLSRILFSYPVMSLIRRPHPRQFKTEISSLLEIKFTNDFDIDNHTPLDVLISKSRLVVTVNSTVGIECLLKGIPVLVLGSSYYDQLYGVLRKDSVLEYLKGEMMLDANKISEAAENLLNDSFIKLDYRGDKFFHVRGFEKFVMENFK